MDVIFVKIYFTILSEFVYGDYCHVNTLFSDKDEINLSEHFLLNVLIGQCFCRRIDNIKEVRQEVYAWQGLSLFF